MFQVADDLLVCYENVAYYVDRRGDRTRRELVMRWTRRSYAFALHKPHLLLEGRPSHRGITSKGIRSQEWYGGGTSARG
ncbi:hypothetical protein C8R47DRAFT_1135253 [Mycena vitilis]|nr:hypothetical protein C8R47DRAFT_1135253 [Mycena vitilis]